MGQNGFGRFGRFVAAAVVAASLAGLLVPASSYGAPAPCPFAVSASSISSSLGPSTPGIDSPCPGGSVTFSYLGGSGGDWGNALRLDAAGNIYVVGQTSSSNFPVTPTAYDPTYNGVEDAFVSKFDPTASSLMYSTFLGGSDIDKAGAMAIDASGNVFVAGTTVSPDFPTTAYALDPSYNGNWDLFFVEFDSSGTLVYGTFFGGTGSDSLFDMAIDGSGATYLTGYTNSADFPTTAGAFDTASSGGFLIKLIVVGPGQVSLAYATFLGGAEGRGVGVDSAGDVYLTGGASSGFPTTPGAYDTTLNSQSYGDGFVAKIRPGGNGRSDLVFSTFLGGNNMDYGSSIGVDSAGNSYIVGTTGSTNFPTTPGSFRRAGRYDAFAVKLSADGSALVYATYLGGSSYDYGMEVTVDLSGTAYIVGFTSSSNFPTTSDAFDRTANGGKDVFLLRLDATGTGIIYSTFIGGSGDDISDFGGLLVVDSGGHVFLVGRTASTNFPVSSGGYDSTPNGSYDAFFGRLD